MACSIASLSLIVWACLGCPCDVRLPTMIQPCSGSCRHHLLIVFLHGFVIEIDLLRTLSLYTPPANHSATSRSQLELGGVVYCVQRTAYSYSRSTRYMRDALS